MNRRQPRGSQLAAKTLWCDAFYRGDPPFTVRQDGHNDTAHGFTTKKGGSGSAQSVQEYDFLAFVGAAEVALWLTIAVQAGQEHLASGCVGSATLIEHNHTDGSRPVGLGAQDVGRNGQSYSEFSGVIPLIAWFSAPCKAHAQDDEWTEGGKSIHFLKPSRFGLSYTANFCSPVACCMSKVG